MKFCNSWSYRPYTVPFNEARAKNPYICRLSHDETSFTLEFIDNGAPDSAHSLMWRLRDTDEFTAVALTEDTVIVDGLATDTDYELYIVRTNDLSARSETRLVRTGATPGKVINYLHPEDTAYSFSGTSLDSPSLVKLPSGRLVASMGVHKKNATHGENLTILNYSDDGGESWHYLCELFPLEWGGLFFDGGKLYCLGVSRPYGDLLIGSSDDGGVNWTLPAVLIRGTALSATGGLHRTPMPILCHNGRLIMDVQCGTWMIGYFLNAVLSAKSGSDLLDINNWAITEWWDHREHPEIIPVSNGGMTGSANEFKNAIGGIEGNPLVTKDGKVIVLHRFGDRKPLVLDYDPEDPWGELKNGRIIDLPIKDSKSPIRYDEVTDRYYMLCNYAPEGENVGRTVCALMWTEDLKNWVLDRIVMNYRDRDPQMFGIQYFDYIFDGDDIIFLSRTACCGASNFHDSNHQTFHRIENFRGKQ